MYNLYVTAIPILINFKDNYGIFGGKYRTLLPLTYPFHFNPTSQLPLYILLSPTQLPLQPSNQPTISIFHVLLESFAAAGQHLTLMKGEPRKE